MPGSLPRTAEFEEHNTMTARLLVPVIPSDSRPGCGVVGTGALRNAPDPEKLRPEGEGY